jgi:outer membrane protein, multidrug efflux system
MRRVAGALCGLGLSLVSACTVGPNYRLPEAAIMNGSSAKGSFVGASDSSVSGQPLPANWWRLYDEPALDALIVEAIAANTDLRMADANLEHSRALVRVARSLQQPSVGLGAGIEYAQLSGEQYLLPVTPPRSTLYDVDLNVGYNLDLFGGIRRGIEAAKAEDEAVEAARDLVRVNVVGQTTQAYVEVCGLGMRLNAARHSLQLQQESLGLTHRLFQGGRAISLDVVRSQQLMNQLTTVIPSLEAAQRNALYRLATLRGRSPSRFDHDLAVCSSPPRLKQPLPVSDGAALLRRRPDVRVAERQLASASAQIGVATAQLYPNIAFGVGAGSVGAKSDAFTSPTNLWQLASILEWQANQSAVRARIAGANANAKLALAHLDGVVLKALADAESAMSVYAHDLERESSARAARDDAAEAANEAQTLQLRGRATALAVLDAQRTLASAESSLAELESAISEDQVAVFMALGGGWESDANPSPS